MDVLVDARSSDAAPGEFEIVERKGLGHPDTICDALAEGLSASLSRFYLERFGLILHHNVDKALLVGGAARPAWGGGEVLEPIEIHLAGRAVTRVGNDGVPVEELARELVAGWISDNLVALDPSRHVRVVTHIRPGSVELDALFRRGKDAGARCNDTSYGVGYAPLSPLEAYVLELERTLNSVAHRERHPAGGEDVKLMATRARGEVRLTVARAFVGRHLAGLDEYRAAKQVVRSTALELAAPVGGLADVAVNASDDEGSGAVYLTVTGTSAEAGDDGEVGRGNRVNGLITPYRPMSLEAAAGKNSVSHVGKLYNIVAGQAARALVAEAEIASAEVFLTSRIGHPVAEPALCHVRLALAAGAELGAVRPRVEVLLRDELSGIGRLSQRILAGEVSIY